jgi:transcriptional regulator with XRE-family HTH domain
VNGQQLAQSRLRKGLEQQQVAAKLGVSQPYLSLLENGKRKLTRELAEKIAEVLELPPEKLPFETDWKDLPERNNDELAETLATLGYPKFSHLRKGKIRNPVEVLFSALKKENLDSRIAEGLPWLVFTFPKMDWETLVRYAKMFDLQNRLGFVVTLARQLAEKVNDEQKAKYLSEVEKTLENSRLFNEAVLSNKSITEVEKKYLRKNRPKEAKHWRVLSDLSINHLDYV